jgi:hypothetical protein
MAISLSGCTQLNNSERDKFLGSWTGLVLTDQLKNITGNAWNITGGINITFLSNGTAYGSMAVFWYSPNVTNHWNDFSGPWSLKDNKLVFNQREMLYNFSANDQKLLLDMTSYDIGMNHYVWNLTRR